MELNKNEKEFLEKVLNEWFEHNYDELEEGEGDGKLMEDVIKKLRLTGESIR